MRLTPLLILLLSVRALLPPTAAHAATAADPPQSQQQQQQLEHHASQLERAPSSLLDQDASSTARRTPLPSGTVCPNCLSHHHHAHHHHHHMHGHPRGAGGGGGTGGSVTQDKDYLRLEAIKHQILSKLGLASKPNITSAVSKDVVLKTIRRAQEMSSIDGDGDPQQPFGSASSPANGGSGNGLPNLESESDDYFGRTSEIIAFAEPGHTLNGQQLLEFAPPQGVEGPELRVKSATLWVRVEPSSSLSAERLGRVRDRNLTLWIFRVSPHRLANTTHLSGKDFDEHTEVSASLSVPMSALGWQKFEVTTTVANWYARGLTDRLRLLVDCSGCEQLVAAAPFAQGQASSSASAASSERPFLVVHTEPAVARRVRRRALECSGGVKQCCKQRFFVSFKQLGWEDWIIAPTGYFANYCKGDCGGVHRTPDTYLNYYTHVIEEYRKLDKLSGIQPCCAPLKFSSMSLIYFGPDSNIIKRDLPKMVVDECGCP